jgi:hypothetical protein
VKTDVVEVERAERDSFAFDGARAARSPDSRLSIDEVLERARAAIEFYAAADVHDRPGRLEVAQIDALALVARRLAGS